MMAKMFYTLEEAQTALGKNEEEIKQFAHEGRLREFRDGPRLMFKADQVEQLKSELGGGGMDHVDLGTSDSGGLIGLVDTGSGPSGTGITMTEGDTGQSSAAGMRMKDDTALAADLGLSGSMGGVPSPGRPASSGTGLSGTATGRQSESMSSVLRTSNASIRRLRPPLLEPFASRSIWKASVPARVCSISPARATIPASEPCSTKSHPLRGSILRM